MGTSSSTLGPAHRALRPFGPPRADSQLPPGSLEICEPYPNVSSFTARPGMLSARRASESDNGTVGAASEGRRWAPAGRGTRASGGPQGGLGIMPLPLSAPPRRAESAPQWQAPPGDGRAASRADGSPAREARFRVAGALPHRPPGATEPARGLGPRLTTRMALAGCHWKMVRPPAECGQSAPQRPRHASGPGRVLRIALSATHGGWPGFVAARRRRDRDRRRPSPRQRRRPRAAAAQQ